MHSSLYMKFLKKPYIEDDRERLTRQLQFQTLKLKDTPVCDFCGDEPPVVIYGANRMTTGELTPCWRWCACADCERLVDSNSWDQFHQKVGDRLRGLIPTMVPTDMVNQAVWAAVATFFRDATRIETKPEEKDEQNTGKTKTGPPPIVESPDIGARISGTRKAATSPTRIEKSDSLLGGTPKVPSGG